MTDYLVDLRRLPPTPSLPPNNAVYGTQPASRYLDLEYFVGQCFYASWSQELRLAHFRGTCRVLTVQDVVVGFACFDATFTGAFGPFGIHPRERKQKLGALLLLNVLQEMRYRDHRYAFIGDVGADVAGFYQRVLPGNCRELS